MSQYRYPPPPQSSLQQTQPVRPPEQHPPPYPDNIKEEDEDEVLAVMAQLGLHDSSAGHSIPPPGTEDLQAATSSGVCSTSSAPSALASTTSPSVTTTPSAANANTSTAAAAAAAGSVAAAATARSEDGEESSSLYSELLRFQREQTNHNNLLDSNDGQQDNDNDGEEEEEEGEGEQEDRKPAALPTTTRRPSATSDTGSTRATSTTATTTAASAASNATTRTNTSTAAKKNNGGKLRKPISRDYFSKKQLPPSSSDLGRSRTVHGDNTGHQYQSPAAATQAIRSSSLSSVPTTTTTSNSNHNDLYQTHHHHHGGMIASSSMTDICRDSNNSRAESWGTCSTATTSTVVSPSSLGSSYPLSALRQEWEGSQLVLPPTAGTGMKDQDLLQPLDADGTCLDPDEALARRLQQEEEEALKRAKSQTDVDSIMAQQIAAALADPTAPPSLQTQPPSSSSTLGPPGAAPNLGSNIGIVNDRRRMSCGGGSTTTTTSRRRRSCGGCSTTTTTSHHTRNSSNCSSSSTNDEIFQQQRILQEIMQKREQEELKWALTVSSRTTAPDNDNAAAATMPGVEATRSVAVNSSIGAVPDLRMTAMNHHHHLHHYEHLKDKQHQSHPLHASCQPSASQQQQGRRDRRQESEDLERALAESAALAACTTTGRSSSWNSPERPGPEALEYNIPHNPNHYSTHHDARPGGREEHRTRDWQADIGVGDNDVVRPDEQLVEPTTFNRTASTPSALTPDWQISQQEALAEFELRRSVTEPTSSSSSSSPPPRDGRGPNPRHGPLGGGGSNGGACSREEMRRRHDMLRRGQNETAEAVRMGRYHIVQCQGCQGQLQAPVHSSLVYCPACGHVSPGQAV